MYIARISVFDEFAEHRVVVCHNREDAAQEAAQLKALYHPQREVEVLEVTIPQALVVIGVINFEGERRITADPRMQAPYLKDLLPYASKRASNAIVNAMTTVAAMTRRRIQEYEYEDKYGK